MIWHGNHLKLRIMLREIAGRAVRCGAGMHVQARACCAMSQPNVRMTSRVSRSRHWSSQMVFSRPQIWI
jgi:hypothetical protein